MFSAKSEGKVKKFQSPISERETGGGVSSEREHQGVLKKMSEDLPPSPRLLTEQFLERDWGERSSETEHQGTFHFSGDKLYVFLANVFAI